MLRVCYECCFFSFLLYPCKLNKIERKRHILFRLEMKDVLKKARHMLVKSPLLKTLASHICFFHEVEVQCFHKLECCWQTVNKGKRTTKYETKKMDAMKSIDFKKDRYRFSLNASAPLANFQEESAPDTVYVIVKLFADKAEIKVQLSMSSRDLGYEETPVLSCMNAVTTGTWLEDHNVFPTVGQFEEGLQKSLTRLGLSEWMKKNDEASESEDCEEIKNETLKSDQERESDDSESDERNEEPCKVLTPVLAELCSHQARSKEIQETCKPVEKTRSRSRSCSRTSKVNVRKSRSLSPV